VSWFYFVPVLKCADEDQRHNRSDFRAENSQLNFEPLHGCANPDFCFNFDIERTRCSRRLSLVAKSAIYCHRLRDERPRSSSFRGLITPTSFEFRPRCGALSYFFAFVLNSQFLNSFHINAFELKNFVQCVMIKKLTWKSQAIARSYPGVTSTK
jgi:hypothetical protein